MHETALIEGLKQLALEQLAPYQVNSVSKLTLAVGRLANAMPDALNLAFEALSQGTLLAGAELVLETLPIEARCRACGQTYQALDLPLSCPACGQAAVDILAGTEVYLQSIDFEGE